MYGKSMTIIPLAKSYYLPTHRLMDAQNQSFEGHPFKVWRCQRLNASQQLLGIIFKLEKHKPNTIEQWSHE
jgi:hypothetical protein